MRRLSDAEKKAKGTFRADESSAALDKKLAEKVIRGVFLTRIPVPRLPLGDIGSQEYNRVAGELLRQLKLTEWSAGRAALFAHVHEKIYIKAGKGGYASGDDVKTYQALLRELDIATHAEVTAPGATQNRFATCGFAYSRTPALRLRTPKTARTRKSG